MVDIFDEVQDDLRAERAQRLLRRHGGTVVAAALGLLIAVGGWQAWRWYSARQDAAGASAYLAAMNLADGLPAGANAQARAPVIAAMQQVAATAPAGYRSLARLWLAGEQSGAGQAEAAGSTWNALADDSGADPLLRDLANLLWAQQNVDKGNPAQVEQRLRPLVALSNPWHQIAQEYMALIYIRTGQKDLARETLRVLAADATAPEGLRGRAGGLLEQLGS